ncbi:flagellar basal body-associated FliL family protein [Massilia sp. YIM B04103]|uniref:flagellar basal body-associated FliL family protein n=1 Tax=Massilia sp. YIM B04103 TaxID=2963106 RepID=UPI0021088B03
MKNMKLVIALVGVAVLAAAVAGGAVWYMGKGAANAATPAASAHAKAEPPRGDGKPPKYLTVDKVIVMLRKAPGDAVPHYMSADLVVATTAEKEKEAKEHLPLLRSIAVKSLSALPMAKAETMSIDQFAEELNKAFDETYEKERLEKPFNNVMIGKMILE